MPLLIALVHYTSLTLYRGQPGCLPGGPKVQFPFFRSKEHKRSARNECWTTGDESSRDSSYANRSGPNT